ncbi:MAG: hypothetical protein WBV64_04380 [Mycobacterium sp.]
MDDGAIQVCTLIGSLTIPTPWDLRLVIDSVADNRGKPIWLLPQTGLAGYNQPCGMWIEREADDIIVYDDETSSYHTEQIVLHELGHILLDHGAGGDVAGAKLQIELMVPDIDPATVRRVLGRSSYDSQDESQAELFASLMLSQSRSALAESCFYRTFFRDADW